MKRPLILIGAALALLCGCAAPPAPQPARPTPPTSHHRPPSQPARDECDARRHQDLVGRPRSEIPVPVLPSLQRVACTTCPVTLDYNPQRLNFFYDAETGVIKEVRCG